MTNLKTRRIAAGITQSTLADRAGVNVRVLQHYEQGSKNIDGAKLETLVNLAAALNCPVSDILENDELRAKTKNVTL